MKFWTVRIVVALAVIGMIMPSCASTKNVMSKATFGLIGGSEKSGEQQQVASAEQETKAERKAREKEEKQQREAEKRAAKDEEKARKAAEKEEKESDGKPGLMSKMTFGLVGSDKKSDEAKQQEADAKAAEKEQKRQEKQARDEEKRAAKAEKKQLEDEEEARKKEEKLAAKEEKAKEKETAKVEVTVAQAAAPAATTPERSAEEEKAATQTAASEEQPKEKRSLMSKMTFGLVGGKKSEEEEKSETTADTSAPIAETASAEPTKEEKKEQKRAEKEQREAEKQAAKEAKQAEKEEAKQAKAAEEGTTEEQPKEKRTLMSKMTFGLIGGGGEKDKSDSGPADETEHSDVSKDSAAPAEPVQPALPPEQLAMAAPVDAQYDVQPASAMDPEARKLAKMPFKTTFDLSTKSSTGKGQATASRETYSKNGYGITDIGDVRIAVQDMKFDDESRAGGVIISSDDRLAAGGKSGTGNSLFNYEYAKGVSAVQFGTVTFTIAKSVISIGGKSIPIGQGKKIVLVDGQGNVIGAYDAE